MGADRSVPTQYHYDTVSGKAEASGSAYAGGDGDLISTGSISLNDGQSLIDSGGDARITFTNAGATIIKDESGNAGITLNTDLTTSFTKNIRLTTGTMRLEDGGAVTQASNRTNGVTLNKLTGKVTGDDASLTAGAIAVHTVTNTTVTVTDVIIINKVSGDADTRAWVDAVANGSFNVAVYNSHGSDADTTAFVYNFVVLKGSIS